MKPIVWLTLIRYFTVQDVNVLLPPKRLHLVINEPLVTYLLLLGSNDMALLHKVSVDTLLNRSYGAVSWNGEEARACILASKDGKISKDGKNAYASQTRTGYSTSWRFYSLSSSPFEIVSTINLSSSLAVPGPIATVENTTRVCLARGVSATVPATTAESTFMLDRFLS
jgi:hypothetical protein